MMGVLAAAGRTIRAAAVDALAQSPPRTPRRRSVTGASRARARTHARAPPGTHGPARPRTRAGRAKTLGATQSPTGGSLTMSTTDQTVTARDVLRALAEVR